MAYTEDIERYAQYNDFIADSKGLDNLVDAARVSGRHEGHGEGGEGDKECYGPFGKEGKPHWVSRVVRDEFNHKGIIFCAGAIVVITDDLWGQKGMGKDDIEVVWSFSLDL